MYTLGKSADLWLLKQEYRALVPDVFYPEEWAYGALFRACEDLMVPEFGLEMWNGKPNDASTINIRDTALLAQAQYRKRVPECHILAVDLVILTASVGFVSSLC